MPVGTIRTWENGEYIKAHDGSKFHNGWIPLSTSKVLDEIGRLCDSLANAMLHAKLPINGEKFLDHEIAEFEKQPGKEFGKYTPDDFKKYEGFAGAARYSFRNEFSRRFMEPKIEIADRINTALLEANRRRGEELGKSYDQIYSDDFLTIEEKADVRAKVRAEYKLEENSNFSVKEAEELAEIVKRTKRQLDAGLNFEGKQKEVYDRSIATAHSLPAAYDRIAIKRRNRDNAIADIDEAFADNWGVRESFRFFIDQQYQEYIRRYKDQIIKDEASDQESLFGVKLDEDPKTFYPKLYERLKDDPDKYPFQELIALRFETKYGKQLAGNWDTKMLPAIEQIESMLSEMPAGHFATNYDLKKITQEDFNGGDHGGYAWYNGGERRINLSKKLVEERKTGVWSRLNHLNEFRSTLAHELGHAVSHKLGRANAIPYKEFVVACGWSYQQEELRRGMTATGGDRDIPREGSMSHLELLTKYAHKSPEEAFAEYYSIYHNNRSEINHWLDTNEFTALDKASRTIADDKPSDITVGDSLAHRYDAPDNKSDIDRLLNNLHLNADDHINVELISPWEAKVSEYDRRNYSPDKVKWKLGQSFDDVSPVVAIKDNARYELLDGVNHQILAKYKRKMLPSVSISRELHSALSSRGYSDKDIATYAVHHRRTYKVPRQQSAMRRLTGLLYRNDIIPTDHVRKHELAFRKMRAIYDSDELAKALAELAL